MPPPPPYYSGSGREGEETDPFELAVTGGGRTGWRGELVSILDLVSVTVR